MTSAKQTPNIPAKDKRFEKRMELLHRIRNCSSNPASPQKKSTFNNTGNNNHRWKTREEKSLQFNTINTQYKIQNYLTYKEWKNGTHSEEKIKSIKSVWSQDEPDAENNKDLKWILQLFALQKKKVFNTVTLHITFWSMTDTYIWLWSSKIKILYLFYVYTFLNIQICLNT